MIHVMLLSERILISVIDSLEVEYPLRRINVQREDCNRREWSSVVERRDWSVRKHEAHSPVFSVNLIPKYKLNRVQARHAYKIKIQKFDLSNW